jgi:hypothetical protein
MAGLEFGGGANGGSTLPDNGVLCGRIHFRLNGAPLFFGV